MVINILKPATASTIASSRLIAGPPRRRLPYAEPIYPPTTATTAHTGNATGNAVLAETTPSSPATEFTKIKAAATPETCRISAQPLKTRRGLKNIPPPTPVKPDKRPSPPPETTATAGGGGAISVTAGLPASRRERQAA